MRLNPSLYLSQIDTEINNLSDPYNNLLYLMSMDEPRAGQIQMYENLQNHLNSQQRKIITAVNLNSYNLIKHDQEHFHHPLRFIHEANPDRIMVNIFPLQWGSIVWNNDMSVSQSVQTKIDNLFHYYSHKLVSSIQSNNLDTEIFYIPQTFGNVRISPPDWSYNMPPLSMVKALKYLPLCYAADGMVDFCVASDTTQLQEDGHWVTPLTHDHSGLDQYNNLRVTENVSAYNMITEANDKIKTYGPIIRGLTWLNANKVMADGVVLAPNLHNEDMIPLSSVLLNNIYVTGIADSTGYIGHVQCGYYSDTRNNPNFMLVNRRAVHARRGVDSIPLKYVDLRFTDASPQIVWFAPSASSHSIFGTHVALYDMYDNSVFQTGSGEIPVGIGPGDGKLVQMCSVLPSLVTVDEDLRTFAVLSGSITIDEGAQVSIQNGTNTTILANSTILVKGGSSFNLTGIVSIKDNVTIIVEEGSTINFNDAVCTWGQGSELRVTGSSLSIDSSSMDRSDTASRWNGIRVADADLVTISDATISNAMYNTINNSNLVITNSKFNIPHS